jgi:hypothetical protein
MELTRARVLEFVREPEAVFWVFVFPVLMAVALGIAFRSQNGGRTPVALLDAGAPEARAELEAKLRASPLLEVKVLDDEAAALALRKTRVEVIVALDEVARPKRRPRQAVRLHWPTATTAPAPRVARRGCSSTTSCSAPGAGPTRWPRATRTRRAAARATSTS